MDVTAPWLGLAIKDWLGLSVLGAFVAAIGSMLGIVVKDFFFSRSLERFKQRQAVEALVRKYHDPLVLATCDMVSRLVEILDHYPTVYLTSSVLRSHPSRQEKNTIHDPYFKKYKLVSTVYRLAALLGWLELYRQELTFLHPGDNKRSRQLEAIVHKVRGDLADGQLNTSENWEDWRDTLIFREELRAIGESMIEVRGASRTVMGYGRYCELFEPVAPNTVARWATVLTNFLLDLEPRAKDFRRIRLQRLFHHLVELLQLLDANLVEAYMKEAQTRHSDWRHVAV